MDLASCTEIGLCLSTVICVTFPLVSFSFSYEDDNKLDDALKSYEKCLSIVPFHEEATSSIQFIKKKMTDVSGLPGITPSKSLEMKETLKQLLKVDQEEEEPLDKHKRKSKKKKERKYVFFDCLF